MNFLAKILRRPCSHRFSWPRTDANGGHYQICLACGAAYEYDWARMRLTGRLMVPAADRMHPNFRSRPDLA